MQWLNNGAKPRKDNKMWKIKGGRITNGEKNLSLDAVWKHLNATELIPDLAPEDDSAIEEVVGFGRKKGLFKVNTAYSRRLCQ
jgi:hypothetical protein